MYDLIIIGGGPAGVAATVYAARKRLRTALIAEEIGGQSVVSEGIENWIGTPRIAGTDLTKAFRAHLEAVKGDVVELLLEETAAALMRDDASGFTVTTASGKTLSAKTVLVASGARRRKLEIPGAAEFEHRGLTYCASCDGPLFSGQDVAVVGGGNAGFETAAQLLAYTTSVTLIHNEDAFRADAVTVEKVLAHPRFRAIKNAQPTSIVGANGFVTGLTYRAKGENEERQISVSGVFVEIGIIPNTDFAAGLLDLDPFRRIKADPRTRRTSVSGIWAAGDCADGLYHQNNIAAGEGVAALEDIYLSLATR